MLVTSCGLKMGHHWGNIWMQDVRELVEASHLECVGCETAVEQYYQDTQQYGMWKGLVAVGGRSSVVRALAAQASDLGSISGGFPVPFHIPFSACVCSINISVYAKTALIGSGMWFEQLYSSIWATAWLNNACTKIFIAT